MFSNFVSFLNLHEKKILPDDIFGTVLSLYMHDSSQSLPTSEEVLICTSDTTAEEVGIEKTDVCALN